MDDAHEVEWEVKSPDDTGLSRFTLWKDGELVPNVRIRSVGEVESGFPAHVLGALRALEGREFVLEGTALEETARKKAKK